MTIVSHGRCAMLSLNAAKVLEEQYGISVEVVDLRSIRPLDEEAILKSVKKTGRAMLVEENKPYCGVDAQISHLIQFKAFDYLDAPVHRVSAIDAPQIYAKPLEDWQIPNEERIIAARPRTHGLSANSNFKLLNSNFSKIWLYSSTCPNSAIP